MHTAVQTPAWLETHRNQIHPAYFRLLQNEMQTQCIRQFSLAFLPGILHTEAYCQAATRKSRLVPMATDEFDRLTQVCMKRQWEVLEQSQPPRIEMLLDEPVLYRQVGGREVLREQLQHLLRLDSLPHLSIRILPMTRHIDYYGDYGLNSFVILQEKEAALTNGLYLEQNGTSQIFTHRISEVRRYSLLFAYLWQEALGSEASRQLIQQIIDSLEDEP